MKKMLSDSEVRMINESRAQIARTKAHAKLRRRALREAFRYECWLNRHHFGSSYSTFVNNFGYQGADSQEMFRVVDEIRKIASGISVSGQPDFEVLKV